MDPALTVHEFDAAGNRIVLADGRCSGERLTAEHVYRRVARLDYEGKPDLFAVITSGLLLSANFWNRDGSRERVCGNALRCIGWLLSRCHDRLEPVWTEHGAFTVGSEDGRGWVDFPLAAILAQNVGTNEWFVDCGTPHAVWMVEDLNDEETSCRALRLSTGADAINVTIAASSPTGWKVRTFERGVGETGSCGTGAIAAFASLARHGRTASRTSFEFPSGHSLAVNRERDALRLVGPLNHVVSRRTGRPPDTSGCASRTVP